MWPRKHVPTAIGVLLALTSLACGNHVRTASAVTVPCDTDLTFDPRAFVCELTGEAVTGPAAPVVGQRYQPWERERARAIISRELRGLGLRPRSQAYRDGRVVYYPDPDLTQPSGSMRGVNLYAELPATAETDDWLVVGAHYDTARGTPGADDNASGVAAVLLVARQVIDLPRRRMNVMFAFFDQEEEWLVGSERFALMLSRSDRNIVTVHNIDMVAWDADGDRFTSLLHGTYREPRLDGTYMDLYGYSLVSVPEPDSLPVGVVRVDTNRGEHTSFEMHGIDAVTLMEETEEQGDFNPNYHGRGDTCDSLDYGYLRECANLVTAAVTAQLR